MCHVRLFSSFGFDDVIQKTYKNKIKGSDYGQISSELFTTVYPSYKVTLKLSFHLLIFCFTSTSIVLNLCLKEASPTKSFSSGHLNQDLNS